MAAFSVQRRLVALLVVVLAAATLVGIQPPPTQAAPPPTYRAPAHPSLVLSPPPPTVMGEPSTVQPSAFASPSRVAASLAAQSMAAPGPALLAANELPVRFVPGTTITTPVTVTNTYSTTLPATYQVSYRWTEVGSTADITTPGDRNYAPLGRALAPGEAVTVNLQVRTPINSDSGSKRLDYDFYLDLWTGTGWYSTTNPPVTGTDRPALLCGMVREGLLCPDRLVEDPTSDQLGLEKFLSYAGEETGAGTQLLTNLYAGNLVWSYDAMQNPSLGPSTFVRLAYNSMDVSDAGAGYGWSVQASTLTRLGTALSVPSGNATKKEMTFVDGDGTTHIYKLPDGETDSDGMLSYRRPAGVSLELARDLSRPVASQWVFTRPDGTRFFYSQDTGLPTSVADINGNTLSFAHDGDGHLSSIIDASGRTTLTLGWSGRHLRWIRDLSGRGVKLTYTATDQLLTLEDGGAFDPSTQTFGAGAPVKKFTFAYTAEPVNKNAKLNAVTDPRGATSTVTYYTATETPTYKLWPKRFTDRRGQGTRFAYTDPDGSAAKDLVTEVIDENGSTPSITTYRMDGFGRTTSIRDANANAAGTLDATKLNWDADHNVIRLEEPNGAVSTWEFDPRTGYPLKMFDAEAVRQGTPPTSLTYTRLTAAPGQPTVLTSVTTPEGRISTFDHDAKGNLTKVTDGLGHATTYAYNPNGTLATATDANSHTTTYQSYDPNGMPQRILDALAKPADFVYDARGNVLRVTDALGQQTTAAYDAFGRPTSITTPHDGTSGRTQTTAYDLNDNVTVETAPTGATTTRTYSPMDELLTVTLPANTVATRTVEYSYDVLGRLVSETSPLGVASASDPTDHQTLYTYDRIGQVLTIKTPYVENGQTRTPITSYTYDKVGNVTKVVDPNKSATTDPADYTTLLDYDLNHQQVSSTDAQGEITRTEYDKDGLVTAEVDQLGNRRTYEYDAAGRVVSVSVPHTPTGQPTQLRTTRFRYDNVGNPTRVTKPSGLYSETVYDALDRAVRTKSPFDPAQPDYATPVSTYFEYDDVGRLTRQSEPTRAAGGQAWTTFAYYPSGDIRQSTDPWNITTAYAYDKNGQQTSRTIRSSDDSANRTMSWTYWPDGSLRSRSDGALDTSRPGPSTVVDNGAPGTSSYGVWTTGSGSPGTVGADYRVFAPEKQPCCDGGGGNYTWPLKVNTTGTYEVQVSCPTGAEQVTYTISTASGTLTRHVSQSICSAGYASIATATFNAGSSYSIRLTGNGGAAVASASRGTGDGIVPNNAVRMVADAVKLVLPGTPASRTFEYDYDADGQRTAVRSLVDGTLRNRWDVASDGLGRTTKVEEYNGNESTWRRSTAYTYDLVGNMLSSFAQRPANAPTNNAAARYTEYTWDVRDMVERVRTGSSPTDSLKTTSFTYDARLMRATMTKPNGNVTTYAYFEDGLPRSTVERRAGGALVARHDLAFTRDGHRSEDVSSVARPGGGYIDQTSTYAYTPIGQLASVMKSNDANGDDEEYRYDAAGNITWQRIAGKVTDFTYDRNRLVTSISEGTTFTHQYDPWGRASTVTALGQVVKRYTYDGFDRMVKDQSYLTNGANDVTKTTTYDAFDRAVSETKQIRSQAPTAIRFVYLGLSEQVATEEKQDAAGAWAITKSYVYGVGGEKIAMVDSSLGQVTTPKTYYYGTNPHGDVETLTDESTGDTKATYAYLAYGGADKKGTTGLDAITGDPVQDDDIVNPYRFSGKRFDGATQKYDMGFRDYDPGLNRYLSRDMYNGALSDMALGMDPWNTNRYAFAGGNPITGVELDGHMAAPMEGVVSTSTSSSPAAADDDCGLICQVSEAADDFGDGWNETFGEGSMFDNAPPPCLAACTTGPVPLDEDGGPDMDAIKVQAIMGSTFVAAVGGVLACAATAGGCVAAGAAVAEGVGQSGGVLTTAGIAGTGGGFLARLLSKLSGPTARDTSAVGASRIERVLAEYGDEVVETGRPVKTPYGSTDIDVVLRSNTFIEVGGPAKSVNLAKFGSQLQRVRWAADQAGGRALFRYEPGTPQEAIDLALKWFGPGGAKPIQ